MHAATTLTQAVRAPMTNQGNSRKAILTYTAGPHAGSEWTRTVTALGPYISTLDCSLPELSIDLDTWKDIELEFENAHASYAAFLVRLDGSEPVRVAGAYTAATARKRALRWHDAEDIAIVYTPDGHVTGKAADRYKGWTAAFAQPVAA